MKRSESAMCVHVNEWMNERVYVYARARAHVYMTLSIIIANFPRVKW